MLDPLPTGPWPVVVVGAGPAGALAALRLARQGVPVLLV
ncbi:MAG: FAD-dependent monooxygenase [Cyanobacteria bacterium]|nr:FAD-dependent monooxygenase [Cyanobacteriota bacterium]